MASLKDIARQSNVSFQTVSAVLSSGSGNTRVSEKTRNRVLKAARDLNYRKHTAGRGLVTGRTHTLGLITPSLRYPLNAEIAEHLQLSVGEKGYGLLVTSLDNHDERTVSKMRMFAERCVDGIIFQPTFSRKDVPCVETVKRYKIPFVLTTAVEQPDVSFVGFDDYSGARQLTHHILEKGYRRPALVTGWSSLAGTPSQVRGFQEVLAEFGVDVSACPVCHQEDFTPKAIRATISDLLSGGSSIDSFLITDSKVAMHAYWSLRDRSIQIGRDFGLASFDDHSWFEEDNLSLTSLSYPLDRMSEDLVDIVLGQIDNSEAKVRREYVSPILVERESTSR